MREILFRGKKEYNGEWGFGSLHSEYGETDINGNRNIDYRILGMRGECDYVIPESVGQFTGLTDKNDKKIFEGDIIKDDWCKIYKVFYSLKSCSFSAECTEALNEFETGVYRIGKTWCDTIRVIGNIHDNPELLKGENNG